MQETVKTRYSVSYHMKDLLRKDVETVTEICKWLEQNAVKPRDVARRTVSKRLMARLIAARAILKAAEGETQAVEQIMNRTEGKVVDRVEHLDVNRMIDQLEAARSRVLQSRAHDNRLTDGQQVIDGVEVKTHALDTGSSGRALATGCRRETSLGPITQVESHVVSPPTHATEKLE